MTIEPHQHLVYHSGALGDFITAIPAIILWKKQGGEKKITFLGRREHGQLGIKAGLFTACIDIESAQSTKFFSKKPGKAMLQQWAHYFSAFLFCESNSPVYQNLRSAGIQELILHAPFPPKGQWIVDYHISAVQRERQKHPHNLVQNLFSPLFHNDQTKKRPIIIHPGSGSPKKNWPLKRFLTVASRLRQKKHSITWVTGPAENNLRFPPGDSQYHTPHLDQIIPILRNAALYIGNDSGITHLAAALGCPTIALFGPSDHRIWSPMSNSTRILYHAASCRPCHRTSPSDNACNCECLCKITVDEVLFEITSLLESCHEN